MNRYEMRRSRLVVLSVLTLMWFVALTAIGPPATLAAPTTSLTIKKLAADGATVIAQKRVSYRWLADPNNIPVMGDGVTHYYHQGPVFVDGSDEENEQQLRLNAPEDTNVREKDMGALKGTNLKDLCDLVGGMQGGDTLKIKAADGLSKSFAYKNVYQYSNREGPMVICWYKSGQYPDSGFTEGMRLVWFADTSTNPWGIHAFGNWDWYKAAESKYWYYYQSGGEKYPTTSGLSVMFVSELTIYSTQAAPPAMTQVEPQVTTQAALAPTAMFSADKNSGNAPLTVQFTDQSTNSPATYAWDFDDNGVVDSTDRNPSYEYSKAGSYTVRLNITNGAGTDEEVRLDYVIVSSAPSTEAPIEISSPLIPRTDGSGVGFSRYAPILIVLLVALGIGIIFRRVTKTRHK